MEDYYHIDEIMGTKLEVLENYQPLYPPHRKPCVYFLLQGDLIVYVGQTIGFLADRIKDHLTDKQFNGLSWIVYEQEEEPQYQAGTLNYWESFWIAQYNPIYNKQMPANDHYLSRNQIIKHTIHTPTETDEILNGVEPCCILGGCSFYALYDLSDSKGYAVEVEESCLP